MRPFLKWAGGKYRLLPHILPALPRGRRLIEPFAGAAAIFLNSQYDDYLLGDCNRDLIMLYRYLKYFGNSFIDYCQSFFIPENNHNQPFYELRDAFNASEDTSFRSAVFLYLNRHAYNGLCRYNSKGKFNAPFGRYKMPYFPRKELLHFVKHAKRAEFIHSDYQQTMQQALQGDVIYCDPPYIPLTTTANFTQYSTMPFHLEQQLQLALLAKQLASRGIPVVISNHKTEITEQYYQSAKIVNFLVSRSISCKQRSHVEELVAIFN